jgi:hypothetical protein
MIINNFQDNLDSVHLNDLFNFNNMQQLLLVLNLFIQLIIEEVKNDLLNDYFDVIRYFVLLDLLRYQDL